MVSGRAAKRARCGPGIPEFPLRSLALGIHSGQVSASPMFEELLAEGAAVPLAGWDFSWFAGRAAEDRPPRGYSLMLAQRMATAVAALDIQTGGGEVLGQIPRPPPVLAATESWPPNAEIARRFLIEARKPA